MRRSIMACGLLLAFVGVATAAAAAGSKTSEGSTTPSTGAATTASTTVVTTAAAKAPSRWEVQEAAASRRHILRFRADTRHWLTVMRGRPPVNAPPRFLAARSLVRLRQLERRWQHLAHSAWWRAKHPPELHGWMCIHRYEGSWADSSGPYWGGLQMDYSFQRTYGSWLLSHKGTADHWSPLEQIWVAVRASHSRGFSPWPSTARSCGLY